MRIEKQKDGTWKVTENTPKDFKEICEYVEYMYKKEKDNMTPEKFDEKVTDTTRSILNNHLQESYIDIYGDNEYLTLVPQYGFGSVEFPIDTIIVEKEK